MVSLSFFGALIGLLAYGPLVTGIIQNRIQQNFATWTLWATLDAIAAGSTILQHGNFWLPLGYTVGASSITLLLIFKKRATWTKFETFISVLVVICLIVWWYAGNIGGIIASSAALLIASIPQIIDTAKTPSLTPRVAYMIFTASSVLSLLGGTSWSVEERLYSAGALFTNTVILALSFRKTK